MNLLLNSINKYTEIRLMDQMTVTVNNTQPLPQHLLQIIFNNQNMSRKEPSQL